MKRLLITGASGQLGAYLLASSDCWDGDIVRWSGSKARASNGQTLKQVDLADTRGLAAHLQDCDPDVILHAGAISTVANCFNDPGTAQTVNVTATETLAQWCAERQRRLVFTSTDLVFDGKQGSYAEEQPANPLSVYGQTKLAAESVVRHPDTMVVRLSLLFGTSHHGGKGFFDQQVEALVKGESVSLFEDEHRTPLHLADAANGLLLAAASDQTGLFHLGGLERLSRWEMGCRLAEIVGKPNSFTRTRQADIEFSEPRPADVSLISQKWATAFPTHVRRSFDEACSADLKLRT